jgi:L-fuculose-phosphate aldolase
VIHAHPPFATAFAVTGEHLTTFIQPETVVFLGEIPFVKYGTPSTDELPKNLTKYLKSSSNTFLLQNHGVLCIGDDLERTYYNLETLENLAKVVTISRLLGREKEIGKKKLKELIDLFKVRLKI